MTLMSAILRQSESLHQYPSPPPELSDRIVRKKPKNKFKRITAKVGNAPPRLDAATQRRHFHACRLRAETVYRDNMRLLNFIRQAQLKGGKVDCHWDKLPRECKLYYYKRRDFLDRINAENLRLYRLFQGIGPKVVTTKELMKDWKYHRGEMINRAQMPFILFSVVPQDICEDDAFRAAPGVTRTSVYMELKIRNGYVIGELHVELFTDICPQTCGLFLELLAGDAHGYGYVGTRFFRKVPHLYWSGGDVTYNNGFGCYAQKGRSYPIGAENYHYSHSMPGLLSMRVTQNDEMCGIFNITFKALPQFDLHNVVFGRVMRPSACWDTMAQLGAPLNPQPCVEFSRSRYREAGEWKYGIHNTSIYPTKADIIRRYTTDLT